MIGAPHSHCLSPPDDLCGNDYVSCTRKCIGGSRAGQPCLEDPTNRPDGTWKAALKCLGGLNNGATCTADEQCPYCHNQILQNLTGPPGGGLMSYCSYLRFEYGPRISDEIRNFVSSTPDAACLRPTTTVTLPITNDTHGFSGAATTTQGHLPYIQMGRHSVTAKGDAGPAMSHAYLSASLHTILPSNAMPTRAILRGRIESLVVDTGLANPTLSIRRTGSFDEATLTLANSPTLITSEEMTPWYADDTGNAAVNVTVLVQGSRPWKMREPRPT